MVLSPRRLSLVWLLVLAAGCASPASPTEAAPDAGDASGGGITGSIVQLTNAERVNAGLAPLRAVGYRWQTYGENIAMGQPTASAVLDSWMHSSGHRANILNSRYQEIGVGYARDSAGRPYYVQVFGTQL
jgi:uncharacterized protein YkwD